MKKIIKIAISCIMTTMLLFVVCPVVVRAALNQSVYTTTYIKVETIESEWSDKNGNILTTIPLPEYVAAGQNVNLAGGIYAKNTGVNAFARVKIESKTNGIISDSFDYVLDANWIKGKDDYYYYCNSANDGIINENEIVLVIETLLISKKFTNSDKDKDLELILTMEVIDAKSNEYISGWLDNPPDEWFSIIENN